MKTKILLPVFITVCGFVLNAQQITVTLQHNGVATMYYGNNGFSDANSAAVDGDTIYLPGNAHYSGVTVSKRVVIIGTGHTPDSTTATGRSLIESDIYFAAGSDSSVLEGIYTNNSIHFTSNTRINYVKIRRCNFSSLYYDGSFDTTHTCLQNIIEQNIIRGEIVCDNSDYLTIRNNLIRNRIRNITQNALIENNVLYYQVEGWNCCDYTLYLVYNSLVRNNIFLRYPSHSNCHVAGSNNDVMNNIFPNADPVCSSSNYSDNYLSIGTDTIFVGQSSHYYDFDYSHDYHLNTPSAYPGYNNMGVGIYGGTVPYKEGALPINPHISEKTIAPATDNDGKLNINIRVNAQDN